MINDFLILEDSIKSLSVILEKQILSVHGEKILELFKKLSARQNQDLSAKHKIIKQLSFSEIRQLTHCFTVFFLLSNQAEQCEIIRIKRQRQFKETVDNPRSESIYEAIRHLKDLGKTSEEVRALCHELSLIPTFTAHPTESRRRSVLKKQLRVADCLFALADKDLPPFDRRSSMQKLEALILNLLVTDDVRATRLSVQDEVENGLFFLAGSVVEVVPHLIDDLRKAFLDYYSADLKDLKPVSYRSWIGGDRDGNPKVTCQTTRDALAVHRQEAVKYYVQQIRVLRDELSVSTRKISVPDYIEESCKADRLELGLGADQLIDPHQVYEPLREKCECITLKLQQRSDYEEKAFQKDLRLIESALLELNLGDIIDNGTLRKIIDQVQAFGFYLAKLDLRQHSDVHKFCIENNDSPEAQELFKLFQLVKEDSSGFGSYIISMTHDVNDMLEPLKLWKTATGEDDFPLDLAPLFETIEDLENCGKILRQIFEDPQYQRHLQSRGFFQEVMLGYSDSNKDGGYVSANILLYEAQLQVARVCLEKGIKFQIFHGRGGSVGRGGGRAGRAIMASPAESHNGKVRLTEQGEVISFRYSMPELAHRHLEQILSAMLLATQTKDQSLTESELEILKKLAKVSMAKYRSLVEHPDFWEWYVRITPIKFISSLPIASRPVMRSGTNLEFENLRAIPWVFSWTQTRYNIPSWFGLGTALNQLLQDKEISVEELQEFYSKRTFFKTLIDNAQQEMARARLKIAKMYIKESDYALHELIGNEFSLTEKLILELSRQEKLLDNNPVIQKSIKRRNPLTDPLSLMQIELLRRSREGQGIGAEDMTEAMHMTISGLAAAMQTTG